MTTLARTNLKKDNYGKESSGNGKVEKVYSEKGNLNNDNSDKEETEKGQL